MKCLKLQIFQESACYKKPFAFKVAETYPLPPYSTVKGFIHSLLNANEFIDMAISIQGTYESIFENYTTFYSMKRNGKITTFPLRVFQLYNVELVIHIATHEDIMNTALQALWSSEETLTLGRAEDVAVLKSAKLVDVQEVPVENLEPEMLFLKRNFYIPKSYKVVENGVLLRIPYRYEVINEIRTWTELVDVYYVQRDTPISSGKVYVDSENDLVFFHKLPDAFELGVNKRGE